MKIKELLKLTIVAAILGILMCELVEYLGATDDTSMIVFLMVYFFTIQGVYLEEIKREVKHIKNDRE